MSRNKIIKMVHDYTGASYAECRRFCKKYNWDYVKIYRMINLFDADAVNDLTAAFDNLKAAICEAGKTIAGIAAEICASYNEAIMRDQSERMQKLAEPFDINKDVFNYGESFTASILNPSEVMPPLTAHCGNVSFPIELEPFDVNDPHTPVFAPYYASTAGNGKLYQNNGGRNTDETGA